MKYLDKVEELATRGHLGQKRTNGRDYISHPISVKNRLIEIGIVDEKVLATALCHDLLEDTKITSEEIEQIAGIEVLESVRQLTNINSSGDAFFNKTAQMLRHAREYNDISKRVKLVDRYDNLADAIWEWQPNRVKKYAKAGMQLLLAMEPLPEDMISFGVEARRFFECLV